MDCICLGIYRKSKLIQLCQTVWQFDSEILATKFSHWIRLFFYIKYPQNGFYLLTLILTLERLIFCMTVHHHDWNQPNKILITDGLLYFLQVFLEVKLVFVSLVTYTTFWNCNRVSSNRLLIVSWSILAL